MGPWGSSHKSTWTARERSALTVGAVVVYHRALHEERRPHCGVARWTSALGPSVECRVGLPHCGSMGRAPGHCPIAVGNEALPHCGTNLKGQLSGPGCSDGSWSRVDLDSASPAGTGAEEHEATYAVFRDHWSCRGERTLSAA